jgi:hypothetical protein
MGAMWQLVIGCSAGALVAASISAPFLLPWSLRVWYLVDAPWTDPFLGLQPAPRLEMRAVKLSGVEIHHSDVEIALGEMGTVRTSVVRFAGAAAVPSVVAKIDGWIARRTPLLMMTDAGQVHIYGPDDAVTELTIAGERFDEPQQSRSSFRR